MWRPPTHHRPHHPLQDGTLAPIMTDHTSFISPGGSNEYTHDQNRLEPRWDTCELGGVGWGGGWFGDHFFLVWWAILSWIYGWLFSTQFTMDGGDHHNFSQSHPHSTKVTSTPTSGTRVGLTPSIHSDIDHEMCEMDFPQIVTPSPITPPSHHPPTITHVVTFMSYFSIPYVYQD